MNPAGSALQILREAPLPQPVVTGFDGFVDEMITLVAERRSLSDFDPVPDIISFGRLVTSAAGHSSLREIVVREVCPGGCAINLGDGLAALGVPVHCFATLGEPPHPAFAGVTEHFSSVHSWGRQPGRTLAFEFNDGKYMFSAVSQLAEFTPHEVRARLQDGAYRRACQEAQVIALTDWTLYPHMTAVWSLLREEIYSGLKHRPHFFFDLVDPSSRSNPDVRNMLELMPTFRDCGPVTLGLNGNEAHRLASVLGISPADERAEDCLRVAGELRDRIGLDTVVIHRNQFAVGVGHSGGAQVSGPFCPRPRKSTGAGDRFNAGFIRGLLAGGGLADCLALGCAVAGYFVREARSPSPTELEAFLSAWQAGTLS